MKRLTAEGADDAETEHGETASDGVRSTAAARGSDEVGPVDRTRSSAPSVGSVPQGCVPRVGMDEEALARVFEPYFSTKATGTGLGLTVAARNVELNRGSVAVASKKGEGTTVTIRLKITS